MTGPVVRRVRHGAEIEELCESVQPLGLLVSSPVNEAVKRLQARCWVVGPSGSELGALTAVRVRPGLMTTSAVLFDPGGAPALADLVRRSGATHLSGGADHVRPIAELIPGSAGLPLEMLGLEHHVLPAVRAADPSRQGWRDWARVARADDVPALARLYREFPLEFLQGDDLEEGLDHLVRQHRVIVVEVDGVIVGAQRVEAQSRRWNFWGGVTILPEHRGQGLSRWLDWCGQERAVIEGRGNAGVVAPTNHVTYEGAGMISEPWLEVRVPAVPTLAKRGKRWTRRQVRSLRASGAR